jgi:hypothetical protein
MLFPSRLLHQSARFWAANHPSETRSVCLQKSWLDGFLNIVGTCGRISLATHKWMRILAVDTVVYRCCIMIKNTSDKSTEGVTCMYTNEINANRRLQLDKKTPQGLFLGVSFWNRCQGDAKNCDIFHVEVCPTIPFRDTVYTVLKGCSLGEPLYLLTRC